MEDDREAFEFAYALHQAQQVDQSSGSLRNWAQASYIDRQNSPSPTVVVPAIMMMWACR